MPESDGGTEIELRQIFELEDFGPSSRLSSGARRTVDERDRGDEVAVVTNHWEREPIMKYMLLIYADEKVIADEAARQHCYEESTELAHELPFPRPVYCRRSAAIGVPRRPAFACEKGSGW